MILELAGLPGSGKTTLTRTLTRPDSPLPCRPMSREEAVAACLRRRHDGRIRNLIKRLPVRLWWSWLGVPRSLEDYQAASARHLELVSLATRELADHMPDRDLAASIWRTFARTFIETGLIQRYLKKGEWVILDEAFCQRCFTLFAYMDRPVAGAPLETYVRLAPVFGPVFHVDASPETCIRRLKQRYTATPSPYELDSETLLRQFYAGRDILRRFFSLLEARGIEIHRLDGETTPQAQAAAVTVHGVQQEIPCP